VLPSSLLDPPKILPLRVSRFARLHSPDLFTPGLSFAPELRRLLVQLHLQLVAMTIPILRPQEPKELLKSSASSHRVRVPAPAGVGLSPGTGTQTLRRRAQAAPSSSTAQLSIVSTNKRFRSPEFCTVRRCASIGAVIAWAYHYCNYREGQNFAGRRSPRDCAYSDAALVKLEARRDRVGFKKRLL
jgi:hypothetical protein